MKREINWIPLSANFKECTRRLGYPDAPNYTSDTTKYVVCQELYDIAFEYMKDIFKTFNAEYGRNLHRYELELLKLGDDTHHHPYKFSKNAYTIYKKFMERVFDFYKTHLNEDSVCYGIFDGIISGCNIDPHFYYNYDIKSGTKEYELKNYNKRFRKDTFEFKSTLEIGNCVVCGKPVEIYEDGIYKDAGIINMSFGYGSRRDCDAGEGFIHDDCSKILEQTIFKSGLKWCDKKQDLVNFIKRSNQ